MKEMSLNIRFNILLKKIIKNENILKIIEDLLTETRSYSKKKFLQISKIYHSYNIKSNIPTNRNFISKKIATYILKKHYLKSMKIADIGGGNGDVLKEVGQLLKLNKNNLYCVENISGWTETYNYSNQQYLQYIFWDNVTIPTIKENSLDVVLIMVSLHHMSDLIIKDLFKNLQILSKVNCLLIIKEHDCQNSNDLYIINWEHHLYEITHRPNLSENDIIKYKANYVDNYKTKGYYDKLIHSYGYIDVVELNRLFEPVGEDAKNPTNLYWKIYKKI
jgi:hypothetical protein